jgi:hypothetical protein
MYLYLQNIMIATAIALAGSAANAQSLEGTWVADPARSSDNDPWRGFEVAISFHGDSVTVDRFWRGTARYTQRDSITVPLDETTEIPIRPGKWMDQVYLGVFVPPDAERAVSTILSKDADSLEVSTIVPLLTSQGETTVVIRSTYALGSDANELILTENRSSRKTGPELRTILTRK